MRKKIVIAGASGLVGSAAVRLFASRGDWDVVAVSRRPPIDVPDSVRHLPVDLGDERSCTSAFGGMSDVTHVIYAALSEKAGDIFGGWVDPVQIGKNAAMLRNLFEPLAAVARGLRHVALVHGGKAYGCHLRELTMPIPMRETLPRVPFPNFYYEQEDYLRGRQSGQSWSWTVLRPVGIAGVAMGSPMNAVLMLLLYAALRKEAGLDMPVPDGISTVVDVTDADLIARALEWAAESSAARNEVFNISNGDVLAQHEALHVVAECFDLPVGAPRRFDMLQEVRSKAGLWRDMVRRYALNAPEDLDAIFGGFMDVSGGWSGEAPGGNPLRWGLVSTIKLRQAGFHDCVDSFEMIRKYARRYRELRILPPLA